MTGEDIELAEWAIPFLNHQAVDIFQPDWSGFQVRQQ